MRSMLATPALAIAALLVAPSAAPAQHYYGSGGHWHYQPGHYHRHGNHWDYHSGGYQYHPTPVYPQYVDPHHYDHHDYRHSEYEPYVAPHVTEYRFGGFGHIDDLAVQMELEANQLCLELHYNYQHNPGYRQTYREAYELLTTAKYIHGLEHAGNRDKIRQAVVEMDALFHHVQDDVAHWTGHHHRHVSPGGLHDKLRNLEETLHHFMDDVGARSEFGVGGEAAPLAPGF